MKVGDQVHYQPEHYSEDRWENGIIKQIPPYNTKAVRVVYNCNNDWLNYTNCTSALTMLTDLKEGWRND